MRSTQLTPELRRLQRITENHARELGLDFFPVHFELLDWNEINAVAAYTGIPSRYPHWRFGMEYDRLAKGATYGLQKIYELVINSNPSYAYLMRSNSIVDQKLVMAHVYGHVDFFKNNMWFSKTNRKMVDEMANHGTRIRKYIDRFGIEVVEDFLDRCLSIEDLIDPYAPFGERARTSPPDTRRTALEEKIHRFESKGYMARFLNPPEYIESQRESLREEEERQKRFPEHAERDVLQFLIEHAPLEPWQVDILSIVREEAYYFAPQRMTKIMNEGWACVAPDTLVYTDRGLVPMREVVARGDGFVSDGEVPRPVTDRHVIRDHPRITIETRRGLRITGSSNHRVLAADGEAWVRLDGLEIGAHVRIGGGRDLWPTSRVVIEWAPRERLGLREVGSSAGVSSWTVMRHRKGRSTRSDEAIATALLEYDREENLAIPRSRAKRVAIAMPTEVDERLGAFLGYLVGDGHISRRKRHLGLTTGDAPQAERFSHLAEDLFGVRPRTKRDGGRLRVLVHSESLSDFLEEGLGLSVGRCAREKRVPEAILRSPEPVVRSFLSALYDCDGYAGSQGVILSTASRAMSEQVQLLLLNFGILSRRRSHRDGCWHVHSTGESAARFHERVGFGLERKQAALEKYLADRRWFKREVWEDEVVSIEEGRGDVYDITVEETHRYVAAGFVNHNSYWHSTLMTTKLLKDSELIDYADHHSGTMGAQPGVVNPYKVGIELFRDIEERWNKGRFGKEYDECDDLAAKRRWDTGLGKGREKIFEVRRIYNDVSFIETFLTEEFCHQHKLFVYRFNPRTGQYEIDNRDFGQIKAQFLFMLTNSGLPRLEVVDANHRNRGELFLSHRHEGIDLQLDLARDSLANVQRIWNRPVHLQTTVDGQGKILSFDGREHIETDTDLIEL